MSRASAAAEALRKARATKLNRLDPIVKSAVRSGTENEKAKSKKKRRNV